MLRDEVRSRSFWRLQRYIELGRESVLRHEEQHRQLLMAAIAKYLLLSWNAAECGGHLRGVHAKLHQLLLRVAPVQHVDAVMKCESATEVSRADMSAEEANGAATSARQTHGARASTLKASSADAKANNADAKTQEDNSAGASARKANCAGASAREASSADKSAQGADSTLPATFDSVTASPTSSKGVIGSDVRRGKRGGRRVKEQQAAGDLLALLQQVASPKAQRDATRVSVCP